MCSGNTVGNCCCIKDSVIGLAESLFSKVSVVFSGAPLPEDHADLCASTGGLCILFNQVDAGDIVELLSSSIEESKSPQLIKIYQQLSMKCQQKVASNI